MKLIQKIFKGYSDKARKKRARMFREHFIVDRNTNILDLGSDTGRNIHTVLQDTDVCPSNVHIADINPAAIEEGKRRYGFTPVLITESGRLPFESGAFDIVFCSSVIEHVTLAKEEVWAVVSENRFKKESAIHQKRLADEIQRIGRQYFVQTPHRHFPIESHTWLPLIAWLPRPFLVRLLRLTNRFWIKKTQPDWCLLTEKELTEMFPRAVILKEKSLGLTKSIMAVRSHSSKAREIGSP